MSAYRSEEEHFFDIITDMAATGINGEDLSKALSALLSRYLVPAEIVFKEWYMATMAHALSACVMTRLNYPKIGLLTGSRTEALTVPDRLSLLTGSVVTAHSDHDLMFPIQNRRKLSDQESGRLVELEPISADPRYFKLIPHPRLKEQLRRRHPSFTDDHLPCRFFTVAAEENEANKEVTVHGPAVKIVNFSAHDQNKAVIMEQDLVDSVMLEEWPQSIADAWLSRQRVSNWPGVELVRSLVSVPCFLTPAGRQGSDEEGLEWRLSFSLPERWLALAVSAAQRTVYVLVKLLMKECAGSCKTFRTYYLKNLLFWLCENEKAEVWQDANLGACLHAFLDLIESCVLSRRLPSYFVPQSNLIDREPEENLREVLKQVRLLRSTLVRSMMSATIEGFFMSVGAVDYKSVWAKISDLSCYPSEGDDNFSNQEKLYLPLIESYCELLRKVVSSYEQATDARIRNNLAIVQSVIKSIIARQIVELYMAKCLPANPLTTGSYCMSWERREFTNFFRSTTKRFHVDADDRLFLVGQAFFKMRLRGTSGLTSGSFLPVAERQLLHMVTECRRLLPSISPALCYNDESLTS